MLKEWPLVAFTIVGQLAVGLFLFATLSLLFPAAPGPGLTTGQRDLIILAFVLGLLVAAAIVSFFHLYHPFRARRALANIRTSWLSREIFFELGFMALVALAIVLVWRRTAASGFLKAVYFAAGLAGILFLLSMIKLYMLETLPFWNQAYTPLSFLLTSLALGSMAAGIVFLSFIFVAADFANSALMAPGHGLFGHRRGPSLRPPSEAPRYLHLTRLALSLAGAASLGVAWFGRTGWADAPLTGNGLLATAFTLVLAGQVIGRFLFYGLLTRPGR
jgi:anaerobic dimethyl sulfoxide reductase subunit C (anchor subunit)